MASLVGSALASSAVKGTLKILAKDRHILIPIASPSKTEILTKAELKKKVCDKPKQKKKRKSNLDRVLERFN